MNVNLIVALCNAFGSADTTAEKNEIANTIQNVVKGKTQWLADAAVAVWLRTGSKIKAIKFYRQESGEGLKDSKDAVEAAGDYGGCVEDVKANNRLQDIQTTPPPLHQSNGRFDCFQSLARMHDGRLSADDWAKIFGMNILDPDGWRHDDGVFLETEISLGEFVRRASASTIGPSHNQDEVPF